MTPVKVYAIRMDDSQFFEDTAAGRATINEWGHIYSVYLYSPQCGKVYIASTVPSAEMWHVDVVPGRYDLDEEEYRQFEDEVKYGAYAEASEVEYYGWPEIQRKIRAQSEDVELFDEYDLDEFDGDCRELMQQAVEDYHGSPLF